MLDILLIYTLICSSIDRLSPQYVLPTTKYSAQQYLSASFVDVRIMIEFLLVFNSNSILPI